MDETTISDIRQRVARWQKEKDRKEAERTWIFAVNVDDVELLLRENERLAKENDELRQQLFQAREELAYAPSDANPTGLDKYWFNEKLGTFKAPDTYFERSRRWMHGPYDTKEQADVEWKLFLRREKENGKS